MLKFLLAAMLVFMCSTAEARRYHGHYRHHHHLRDYSDKRERIPIPVPRRYTPPLEKKEPFQYRVDISELLHSDGKWWWVDFPKPPPPPKFVHHSPNKVGTYVAVAMMVLGSGLVGYFWPVTGQRHL